MTTLKTIVMAVAMIAGATSWAMAQSGPATGGEPPVAGGANASTGMPPAAYKGPGGMPTYKGSDFSSGPALYNQAAGGAPATTGTPPAGSHSNCRPRYFVATVAKQSETRQIPHIAKPPARW
jgi:hypothetical protein